MTGEHTQDDADRGGWIKVPRDLLDRQHPLHPYTRGEPACRAFAFADLLGRLRWRDGAGLEAGETRASVRFLAERWRWSKSKAARFLAELEADGVIEREEDPAPYRAARIRVLDDSAARMGQAPPRNDGAEGESAGQG